VTQARDGRSAIYRTAYEQMSAVRGFQTGNCYEGQTCLERGAGSLDRRRARDFTAVLTGVPDNRPNRESKEIELALGIGSDHVDLRAAAVRSHR
jgi:hypothetical protein